MALSINSDDKAFIKDEIADVLAALVIPAADGSVRQIAALATAVAAATTVNTAYTGP